MCGIAGVLGRLEDPEQVGAEMARRLRHRGPDASGVSVLGPSGAARGVFAHTRLAVIDLSEAAAQPFLHAETGVQLVFNGEIYGFEALRSEQAKAGFLHRSRSDTEVVIAQYILHGERGLDAIDGMFALALWDPRTEQLILARDRMGKKPLYWAHLPGGGLAFASEAKALGAVPGVSLELEPAHLPEYLCFGYVGTPRSIFRGIQRLPAASRMRFREGRAPHFERFWSLEAETLQPLELSVDEAKRRTKEVVARAVRRRMVADVPLGAFLSGGVDSSVVVAEMAAASSRPVRTFSVGFDDDASFDETQYARGVAQQFGTDHTELRVRPDAERMFERLAWHHDEPYGDSSALAVHAVAEATRHHVTVVLTGDGGDEVFGGYTRFHGGLVQGRVPGPLGRLGRAALERLPEPRGYKNPLSLGRRFVEHAGRSRDEQLLAWNSFFVGPRLGRLMRSEVVGPEFQPWSVLCPQLDLLAAARSAGRDRLDQILLHNLRTYLLDDLLVKTDRMTMAVSLEARSPFLDRELVEFAFRLPSQLKIRGSSLKWILREAYRGLLGPEVLDRKKHGFGVPLAKWWSGPLKPLAEELLGTGARCASYLEPKEVRALLDEHFSARRDHGQRIFALVQLELFLRRIEGDRSGDYARAGISRRPEP